MIETHIPQGEPLREADCLLSFRTAAEFFARHFPQQTADYFQCHSWLLNPHLAELLDAQSNLVRFMRLWTILHMDPDDSAQAIERVFGFHFRREQLADAPEHTTLQRMLKRHLLSGASLDTAVGCRRIPAVSPQMKKD